MGIFKKKGTLRFDKVGWYLLIVGILFIIVFTIIGNFIDIHGKFDPDELSKYGGFIGGTVGVIFSLIGYFLVYEGLKQSKITQFENTFFNLFNSFQEFRTKQIALIDKDEIKYGYDFFETLFRIQFEREKLPLLAEQTEIVIKDQLKAQRNVLSHYFGILNMLLKKIYDSELSKKDKDFYIVFVNSVLNRQEKFLIEKIDLCLDINDYKYIAKFRK